MHCAGVHGNSHSLNCLEIWPFSGTIWPKIGPTVDLSGLSLFLLGLFWVNRPNFRLTGNMHASPRMGCQTRPISWAHEKSSWNTFFSFILNEKNVMICTILYSICKHWELRLLFWIKQKHLLKKVSITELREGDLSEGNPNFFRGGWKGEWVTFLTSFRWLCPPSAWSLLYLRENLWKKYVLERGWDSLEDSLPHPVQPGEQLPLRCLVPGLFAPFARGLQSHAQ